MLAYVLLLEAMLAQHAVSKGLQRTRYIVRFLKSQLTSAFCLAFQLKTRKPS